MNHLQALVEVDLPGWVEETAAQIETDTYRDAYLEAARLQTIRNLAEMVLQAS